MVQKGFRTTVDCTASAIRNTESGGFHGLCCLIRIGMQVDLLLLLSLRERHGEIPARVRIFTARQIKSSISRLRIQLDILRHFLQDLFWLFFIDSAVQSIRTETDSVYGIYTTVIVLTAIDEFRIHFHLGLIGFRNGTPGTIVEYFPLIGFCLLREPQDISFFIRILQDHSISAFRVRILSNRLILRDRQRILHLKRKIITTEGVPLVGAAVLIRHQQRLIGQICCCLAICTAHTVHRDDGILSFFRSRRCDVKGKRTVRVRFFPGFVHFRGVSFRVGQDEIV